MTLLIAVIITYIIVIIRFPKVKDILTKVALDTSCIDQAWLPFLECFKGASQEFAVDVPADRSCATSL